MYSKNILFLRLKAVKYPGRFGLRKSKPLQWLLTIHRLCMWIWHSNCLKACNHCMCDILHNKRISAHILTTHFWNAIIAFIPSTGMYWICACKLIYTWKHFLYKKAWCYVPMFGQLLSTNVVSVTVGQGFPPSQTAFLCCWKYRNHEPFHSEPKKPKYSLQALYSYFTTHINPTKETHHSSFFLTKTVKEKKQKKLIVAVQNKKNRK